MILIVLLLSSCGKTKTIYKTQIKEVQTIKLIPIDPTLTELIVIPYWNIDRSPTYLDLKILWKDTQDALLQCNDRLTIINLLNAPKL